MLFVVYLHGFLSGGKSIKGEMLRKNILKLNAEAEGAGQSAPYTFRAPDYPDAPKQAVAYLERFFTELKAEQDNLRKSGDKTAAIGVFGSSMGGFYATLFAARFDFKAVLINPCVGPSDYMPALIGAQQNPYSGERFELTAHHIAFMRSLEQEEAKNLQAERFLVLLQAGDEVLDYRRALHFYEGAKIEVQPGGCHAFTDFESRIGAGLKFLSTPCVA